MGVELIEDRRVVEDERPDFSEFFEVEYRRLGKALYLLTGDRVEADDIAQEALVRVYERWDRVGRARSPTGYLYRTALNLRRSRLRRLRTASRHRAEERPGDPLAAIEERTDVMAMLTLLPRQQRTAVVLVDWLALDISESARIMRIKESTVRVHLSRGRKALRESAEVGDE